MRTAYPPLPTEPRTPLARVNESGWAGSREGARKRESSRSWLGKTKIPAHGLAVSVESRSAVGNDRVSHAVKYQSPSVTWCVSENQVIVVLDLFSVPLQATQDTYRMALGRFSRTLIEPRTRCCRVNKEMCTALLIAYLGSIALAALGGEAWKRSKVERCNSL